MRGPSPRTGFTVVELLVAVAVVAVVAAILVSVYSRVQARGRQAECLSNLRQLGAACLIYAQDNDGYMPVHRNVRDETCCRGTSDGSQGYCDPEAMYAALSPFVKDAAVWFCPEDQFAGLLSDAWCVDHVHSSYSFNFRKGKRTGGSRVRDTGKDGIFPVAPAEYLLISDPNWNPGGLNWPPGGNHFEGRNACFLDGHAKWRPYGRT